MFDLLLSMEQTLESIKIRILLILARNKGNLQHTWCAHYTSTILGIFWGAHWVSLLNPLLFGHLYETENGLQN